MRVLIAGVSTRAVAQSAARAGFDVIALDAYGDLDQHPAVRALSLPRDFHSAFSPEAVVAAAREIASDAVVYLSNLENHPEAVEALARGRALWGNSPDVLRRVRNPRLLHDSFERRGIHAPQVITSATRQSWDRAAQWLIKPRTSGGGHGVRMWRPNEGVTRGHYLQEFIGGVPGSVVFASAGGRGVPIATSRQMVGDSAFGATGFRYCGSILNTAMASDRARAAADLVAAVSAEFSLAGVGSIDFISAAGGMCPIEVNPRWSASMELVERARQVSVFEMHAAACTTGLLPQLDPTLHSDRGTHGKAIVFARTDSVVGDTNRWVDDPDVSDVPRGGEHIAAGQPICTVFAAASDEAACYTLLVERAERIYQELGDAAG